jgi:hypothetical protein
MLEQRDLRHRNGYRTPHPLPKYLEHRLMLYLGDVHPISC